MANFFEDQWHLCAGAPGPCTGTSPRRRLLQIQEFDGALMPGFLSVTLDGNPVGYGYAVTDGADTAQYKLYFFEALVAGGAVHYAVNNVVHDSATGKTQIQGKLKRLKLNGEVVPLMAGDDDWTSNRPTA